MRGMIVRLIEGPREPQTRKRTGPKHGFRHALAGFVTAAKRIRAGGEGGRAAKNKWSSRGEDKGGVNPEGTDEEFRELALDVRDGRDAGRLDVVVVGAGPAGIAAARALVTAGRAARARGAGPHGRAGVHRPCRAGPHPVRCRAGLRAFRRQEPVGRHRYRTRHSPAKASWLGRRAGLPVRRAPRRCRQYGADGGARRALEMFEGWQETGRARSANSSRMCRLWCARRPLIREQAIGEEPERIDLADLLSLWEGPTVSSPRGDGTLVRPPRRACRGLSTP